MKKFVAIVGVIFGTCCFGQKSSFYLCLKINNLPPGIHKIDLCFTGGGRMDSVVFSDSVSPEKNEFKYTGTLQEEQLTTLKIRKILSFQFALGPNDTAILELTCKKVNFDYKLSGTKVPSQMANYLYNVFVPQSEQLNLKRTKIDSLKLTVKRDAKQLKKEKRLYDSLFTEYFKYNTAFADTTASACAVYYALSKYLSDTGRYYIYPNVDLAIRRFDNNTPAIKALSKDYAFWQHSDTKLSKGDTLPFTLFPKTTRDNIKKRFYKNRLILIDFWASWCIPCREEFPFLNEAYRKFHSKKFDIVSISLDNKQDLWQKAIKSLEPLWQNHYIEKDAWDSPIVKGLNIKSIPRNYLIDKNGKVYAKDLRQSELIETLNKLL